MADGRRRNLFILIVILGLTAASAIVIATKPTVLGLDLRGGTQLVYQARPTPQTPEVTPDAIDRAIEIIRKRTDTLGVSEPEISRLGATEIQVGLPNVQNAAAGDQADRDDLAALLLRLRGQRDPAAELERPEGSHDGPGPNPNVYTFPNLYEAVKFASKRKPECFHNECTTNGPTYYLFDSKSHQLLAGPAENKKDLKLPFKNGKQPPGSTILSVPQGTVVVQAESQDPTLSQSPSEISSSPQYVFKDRPALSGDDITNPEQNFDSTTNQPNVIFDFTDAGRTAFRDVTRKIAERGEATAPPGTVGAAAGRPVLAALLGRARQPGRHPADHQLRREPAGDRREDRRPDLRQLHDRLGAGPGELPEDRRAAGRPHPGQPEHRLGDARPAGARPGAAGRDRRAGAGRAVPDRLLPPARRCRRWAWSSTGSSSSPSSS